jgi:adenylate kinase family enzyme
MEHVAMQKVAVFGNTGGGKSTLSQQLAEIKGLPLHILDKIQFQPGGAEIPAADYQRLHRQILATDRWIIDGFGSLETVWQRLDQADTLIFVDLPLYVHFGWVTKRLLTGYFNPPAGWPERSPLWASSLNSYRTLWLCHQRLTPRYRQYIAAAPSTQRVYHLRSPAQIAHFWATLPTAIGTVNGDSD